MSEMINYLQNSLRMVSKFYKTGYYRPKRILQVISNFIKDIKFGNRYLGISLDNGNEARGYINTGSTEYSVLNHLFAQIKIRPTDVIVDVGCGKGRVFNGLLDQKIKNKLIGIEVDPRIAEFTRSRLIKYPQVEIIAGDFSDVGLPVDASVFYLFHPFRELLVRRFADELLKNITAKHFSDHHRPVIIYHNCCYLHVFEENPVWGIQKLGFVGEHESAIIWHENQERKD